MSGGEHGKAFCEDMVQRLASLHLPAAAPRTMRGRGEGREITTTKVKAGGNTLDNKSGELPGQPLLAPTVCMSAEMRGDTSPIPLDQLSKVLCAFYNVPPL